VIYVSKQLNNAAWSMANPAWALSYDSPAGQILCQAEYLGKLYAGGDNGNIYVFDGTTWALSYDSASHSINALYVWNGKLYAGGGNSYEIAGVLSFIYVFDSTTWEVAFASDPGGGYAPKCLALCALGDTLYAGFKGGSFYSPGAFEILKTTNGTTWTISQGWVFNWTHALTVFNGNLYSAGETHGIWKLTIATGAWSQVDTTEIFWYALYVWNNKIYAGGGNGKILVSSNGSTWTEAVDLGAGNIRAFYEYNAKLLAAYDDKIYETVDGTTWTLFYDSVEAAIYSLILFGTGLYAGTGSAGKILVYNTIAWSCAFAYGEILDLQVDGVSLTRKYSQADCITTVNSYFHDHVFAGILYVHITGGASPGTHIAPAYVYDVLAFYWRAIEPIFSGDLGPCELTWNGVYIGPTQGGVKIKFDAKAINIKEDGHGCAALDAVFIGAVVADIEVPLTRFTLDELNALTKDSVLIGSELTLQNPVGSSMYENAQPLILKPLVNGAAAVLSSQWITFFKAFPAARWEFGYDNNEQRIYKVAFKIFVCQEAPNINDIFKLGG